jgi:hypothetical protein
MKRSILIIGAVAMAGLGSVVRAEQTTVSRIEKMPAIPQPYEMRDWKAVARGYVDLVLNQSAGQYMPLSKQEGQGNNYPEFTPIFMDSYVGGESHGSVAEAINIMPAAVTAYLTGNEARSAYRLPEGIVNFYNAKNGQNVYLNGYSEASGNDWWYDVMPNVFFYQLRQLAPMPDEAVADEQYRSIANRWLAAVEALGGSTYDWKAPSMSYRAFNLSTMQPLASGVNEPESAGSIAWLLFHAYLKTGEEKYRRGAELSMDYLSSLGSNPSYELQLAYGVQVAAKMNAMLGTGYRVSKLFGNCFDRGYLRGWGSIVGTWGGYDVSGLIGEANDAGNDYAFVMNGFQQAAALAPAVKYDKRLARAYGRWMLNVANASRLFYPGFLPESNSESASYQWSRSNDANSVIPYESMKEKWNGVTPFAMGDAVGGGWAATNLSFYSGSSVGYLAAVVATTNVEAILQLDLNVTDFDDLEKYPTYLYYNPYTTQKSLTVALPQGSYKIYDTITETTLAENQSGSYTLAIPADEVRMVVLVPQSASLTTSGRRVMAGDVVVDYHKGYNYDKVMRIKNVEAADSYPVKGTDVTVKAIVDAMPSGAAYSWLVDGVALSGQTTTTATISTTALTPGVHIVTFRAVGNGETLNESTEINVLTTPITVPEITSLSVNAEMPVNPSALLTVNAALANPNQSTNMSWHVDDGTLAGATTSATSVEWRLPATEGVFTVTCTATTIKGSVERRLSVLVRKGRVGGCEQLMYFPLDGDLGDVVANRSLTLGSGSLQFVSGHSGDALKLTGNYCYLNDVPATSLDNALTIAFWANPQQWNGNEQFIVSHGSWQDRYKASITPEKHLRWTVKTNKGVVDVDATPEMEIGRYDHYCVVFTGFSTEVYYNGKLSSFAALGGSLGSTSQGFTLGAMTTSEPNYNFTGYVDELMMFDGALSPTQIAELYSTGTVGVESVENDVDAPVVFVVHNGTVTCADSAVNIIGVYGIDGRSVATVTSGCYIVAYCCNGATATCKLLVK